MNDSSDSSRPESPASGSISSSSPEDQAADQTAGEATDRELEQGSKQTPAAWARPAPRPIGWGLALIGGGVLWLLHLAGVTIVWEVVLPVIVVAIGLALVAGGRHVAQSGLIGLGVVLTVVAVVLSMTPMQVSLTAGDRNYTVTEFAELESSYSLGAGTLTLDLRDLELPDGTTELAASVSMGELVVLVPEGVSVTGTGHTMAGEVVAFGRTTAGVSPRRTLTEAGADGGPVLDLQLRTIFGRIEVTR